MRFGEPWNGPTAAGQIDSDDGDTIIHGLQVISLDLAAIAADHPAAGMPIQQCRDRMTGVIISLQMMAMGQQIMEMGRQIGRLDRRPGRVRDRSDREPPGGPAPS